MSDLIRESVPLAPFTWYRIGGPARWFAQPTSSEQLKEISEFIRSKKISVFVLGAGSNLIVRDQGFDGLVIRTTQLDQTLNFEGEILECGASIPASRVLRLCMEEGLGGLELLAGIPGNMGGIAAMNAGTNRGEFKDILVSIDVFDLSSGKTRTLSRADLDFEYRKNRSLKALDLVTRIRLRGKKADPADVRTLVTKLLDARKKSQPVDKPSCGSVFKNPDPAKGVHAWKLISDAGLRGHRIGGAQISELHTNFIVNLGGATSTDVLSLIAEAKKCVHEKFGITLEEEVKIV